VKRSAIARSLKRLRPRSAKQAKAYVARRAFVAEFLASHPWCQARFKGCWGRSTTVNELIRRSHLGAIVPGDEAEAQGQAFHALCQPCHDRITFDPAWARANGWEER
jgi:hypothetical protein